MVETTLVEPVRRLPYRSYVKAIGVTSWVSLIVSSVVSKVKVLVTAGEPLTVTVLRLLSWSYV